MKKIISSILILIIFISSFTFSFANKTVDKVFLKESGKGQNYQVVNIKINGTTVESVDVPPVIYPLNNQGRTLVPLRMIIEHLEDKIGANIEWNGDKLEATIKTKEKEIALKIDSPDAVVNGVKKRLPDDVPAKLLAIDNSGRTMVPIRFFAEELGLKVGWDEKTVTALIDVPEEVLRPKEEQKETGTKPGQEAEKDQEKDIEKNPDKKPEDQPAKKPGDEQEQIIDVTDIKVKTGDRASQIRIKTTAKPYYNQFKLADPQRLVIDIDNAKFSLKNQNKLEDNKTFDLITDGRVIKRVRASQFEKDPSYITRLVVEFGEMADYEINFNEETKELVIDFPNHINNVKKELINAKEVIVIEGDSVEDYNIMRLNNPERVVVDIKDSVIHKNFSTKTLNIDGKVAKTIRLSQYKPEDKITDEKSVRIVIDLKEDVKEEDCREEDIFIEVEGNKLKIHLEGEPFKTILYEEMGWTTSRFTLKGLVDTVYDVSFQPTLNIVHIAVPKEDIELMPMSLKVDDHIIKTIDIGEDEDNYSVELHLQQSVKYQFLSPEHGQDLILELSNKDAKYREILIVVDPGHGGSDPGTISTINKAKEAEVVLDISLRLNKLLIESGFRTYMTRVDNLKVELQERTDIANALEADLFVSVHANSFTGNSVSGIETFYHSTDPSGKILAKAIQTKLIQDLKMIDRGAKSENYFVLRNSKMPAALVETGFLSNASDAAKLVTDGYRQQVAESILKGIIDYFESTR